MEIGDRIVCGSRGICEVTDRTTMDITGKMEEYFVLVPLSEKELCLYVSVANLDAYGFRPVISREAAESLLKEGADLRAEWIGNDRKRKEEYKALISRGEPQELMGLVNTLLDKQEERAAMGKRLYAADDALLKSAQRLLYTELAYALEIDYDRVAEGVALGLNPQTNK